VNEIGKQPDGRAAVLTPSGRGAVAIIRLIAPPLVIRRAGFSPASGRSLAEQPLGQLWFGFWGEEPSEEVVLGRRSECEWDLHCHGGYAAVSRILAMLRGEGWQTASWQELLAESEPFPLVEHRAALSLAVTWRTTETLLRQRPEQFVAELQTLASELDSPDWNNAQGRDWSRRWSRMLEWKEFARHLTEPFRVILAGEPNVGKSSLLNRLAGFERAIVHDQPGTTRDVVRTPCAFEGWPFELSDTAGIRTEAERLEALGIEKSLSEIAAADLVLFLVDVSRPADRVEKEWLRDRSRVLQIGHKADLTIHPDHESDQELLLVSSHDGTGVEELIAAIVRRLVPEVPPDSDPLPLSRRQAELLESLQAACERSDAGAIRILCRRLLTGRD
jgi:tRNA modification GTPase